MAGVTPPGGCCLPTLPLPPGQARQDVELTIPAALTSDAGAFPGVPGDARGPSPQSVQMVLSSERVWRMFQPKAQPLSGPKGTSCDTQPGTGKTHGLRDSPGHWPGVSTITREKRAEADWPPPRQPLLMEPQNTEGPQRSCQAKEAVTDPRVGARTLPPSVPPGTLARWAETRCSDSDQVCPRPQSIAHAVQGHGPLLQGSLRLMKELQE